MAIWKRKPQEQDDQDYHFSGQCFMTAGVSNDIPQEEVEAILIDLYAFAKEMNGVDYLQVYESDDGRTVWVIDQLNQDMIASGEYETEYNYHTILFPHEY